MASSSADVVLAYALTTGVGVLAVAAALRGTVASYVWTSLGGSQGAGWLRRTGRWLRTVTALVLTGLLAGTVVYLSAAIPAYAAGSLAEDWVSHRQAVALGVTMLGAVLVLLLLGTLSMWWIGRQRRRFGDEAAWAPWVEPDWQSRLPRAVAFAAWQSRLVAVTGVVVLLLALGPFLYDIGRAVVAGFQERKTDQLLLTGSVTGLVLTGVVVGLVVPGSMLLRPDWYLADHALDALRPRARGKSEILEDVRGGPARWRSARHRTAFAAAGALRRCIPRFRRRLTREQYETVALAAVRVAGALRQSAVTAHRGGDAEEQVGTSVRAGVALVFSDDLARTLDAVGTAFPPEERTEPTVPSRTRLFLEGASDSVLRHWPAVKAVLVVCVVVALIATGQLLRLVDLLKG